jgi:DnaJ-domain-containing protein 1
MNKIHTHYDNLKVSRDAPIEVIRAAYKSLAQKYHPDRNPGNDDATRVMTAINAAYEVLSDPAKRAAHDRWIAGQEFQVANETNEPQPPPSAPTPPPAADKVATSPLKSESVRKHIPLLNVARAGYAGVFAFIVYAGLTSKDEPLAVQRDNAPIDVVSPSLNAPSKLRATPQAQTPPSIVSLKAPAKEQYIRRSLDPYGRPWPESARLIKRFDLEFNPGLSSVTVDNSQNDSDVHVKLVLLALPWQIEAPVITMREFFIPARSAFYMNGVIAGKYDVRYRDLTNGALAQSDPFDVTEIETSTETQFSNITMTLYKVRNGNMQTHEITEADF